MTGKWIRVICVNSKEKLAVTLGARKPPEVWARSGKVRARMTLRHSEAQHSKWNYFMLWG